MRNRDARRRGRLAVDHRFNPGWLLHRQVRGPPALENRLHVFGGALELIAHVQAMRHQAAGIDQFRGGSERRGPVDEHGVTPRHPRIRVMLCGRKQPRSARAGSACGRRCRLRFLSVYAIPLNGLEAKAQAPGSTGEKPRATQVETQSTLEARARSRLRSLTCIDVK